jgi:hypothetical protein
VIDALLAERGEDLLQELGRVAVAVARGEAVTRVPGPIRDVQIADVREAYDGRGC